MSAKSDNRSNKAAKTEEPKKRRRKKARTADISDSDSSESENDAAEDDEEDETEEVVNDEPEDVEMMEFEKTDAELSAGLDIPSELQNLPEDAKNPEFQKFYMNLVTSEFGKDMDELRTSKTFTGNTLGLLVDALKQGVNVFDEETQKEVVGA